MNITSLPHEGNNDYALHSCLIYRCQVAWLVFFIVYINNWWLMLKGAYCRWGIIMLWAFICSTWQHFLPFLLLACFVWHCFIYAENDKRDIAITMTSFSALLALCTGNSPVTGEFSAQRPVTLSFDALFDQRLNKQLSKQPWSWWSETPLHSLWRQCNDDSGP